MTILDDYKSLTGKKSVVKKYPKSFVPNPTSADYTRGYITRYFVKPTSNRFAPIIEVDSGQYKLYSRTAVITPEAMLYSAATLRWKISGSREQIINSNSISVSKADKILPGIRLKLGNLLQFSLASFI